MARPIRAPSSCGSTPRLPAARSPRSSRPTTSSGWRCRRCRRCSAAPSRCTATAATRRSAFPPSRAATLALRTQQILLHESGVAQTVDPFGGAYAIEELTSRIEAEAERLLEQIRGMGGTLAALESGFVQRRIHESAYRAQRAVEEGAQIVVGVNRFVDDSPGAPPVFEIDPAIEREQIERRARGASRPQRAGVARGRSAPSSAPRKRRRQPGAAGHRRGGSARDARRNSRYSADRLRRTSRLSECLTRPLLDVQHLSAFRLAARRRPSTT